jgi:molybdenum-dependent DNA-binding transcriptional regulator ModE
VSGAGAGKTGAAELTETGQALARLEAAVERLAIAAARSRASTPAEGVPRAQVQAIADRLDETIARLRTALGEEG